MSAGRSSSRRVALLCCLGLLALTSAVSAELGSGARYSAASSNATNSFTASASFGYDAASGLYDGTNNDDHTISGLGFRPDFVIVRDEGARSPVIRTSTMTGDLSKETSGTIAAGTNRIQALTADGFQVGDDDTTNDIGDRYQWFASTVRPGAIAVGSYVGNGQATRAITTPGVAPNQVLLIPESTAPLAIWAGSAARLDSATTLPDSIKSFSSTGFDVGASTSSNANGVTYHWIAFQNKANLVGTGTYAGNNANNRVVSGVGFTPAMMIIRANPVGTTSRNGVFRASAWAANASSVFSATANVTTALRAFGADSFTLNSNANVNANGANYTYLALGDP